MHPASNGNTFLVLDIALQAAGTAIAIVDRVPTKFKSLTDQVIRSASSVPANLAEGNGLVGKSRLHHYRKSWAVSLLSSPFKLLHAFQMSDPTSPMASRGGIQVDGNGVYRALLPKDGTWCRRPLLNPEATGSSVPDLITLLK